MNRPKTTPTQGSSGSAMRSEPQDFIRYARAALSGLIEPGDGAGHALIRAVGPARALRVIDGQERLSVAEAEAVGELLESESALRWHGLAPALERWRPRLPLLNPARDLHQISSLAGGLLTPESPGWPSGLVELGLFEPIALWFRGPRAVTQGGSRAVTPEGPLLPPHERCLAIVGARESTDYGITVATELTSSLAPTYTIVSGGACGIDAAAHRAALETATATAVRTIAVMAGGLDRLYPRSNTQLHADIAATGLLVAEVPPGAAPTRYRFLHRNRIIAALSTCTVVIQARWRSGALNTANHAVSLGRSVGAVPGSVIEPHSAGCHRLIQEGAACITDAQDVLSLCADTMPASRAVPSPSHQAHSMPHDGLEATDLVLFDALPLRRGSTVENLAREAGVSVPNARACLGRLQLLGIAVQDGQRWHKVPGGRKVGG